MVGDFAIVARGFNRWAIPRGAIPEITETMSNNDEQTQFHNPPPPDDQVERYRPLVLTHVRGLFGHSQQAGVDVEDLFQEANAMLVELARDYAPERGVPFGNYLKQKLKWHLVNLLARELRRKNRVVEIDQSAWESLVEEPEVLGPAEVLNPRLRAALRCLSPRQRRVLYGIYWREKTAQELAGQLGVTPQSITALRRRAESLLRQGLDP